MAQNPKSGWKTTEFWASLASQVVGLAGLIGVLPVPANVKGTAAVVGGVVAAVANAAYSISRALTKRGPQTVNAPTATVNTTGDP
jgi:hypothetical protein